jgi:hypothetical protein
MTLETRREFLALVARRQKPGSGSQLTRLEGRAPRMDWWKLAERALEGVPHAIAGAVAANAYMPPRQTRDLDIVVGVDDFARAGAALEAAGWRNVGALSIVAGATFSHGGHDVDLLQLPQPWAAVAIEEAQSNLHSGMPTLTLPYLAMMKLNAGRATDMADLTRMFGGADDRALDSVRDLVLRQGQTEDIEDLEQAIRLGKLEREGT